MLLLVCSLSLRCTYTRRERDAKTLLILASLSFPQYPRKKKPSKHTAITSFLCQILCRENEEDEI